MNERSALAATLAKFEAPLSPAERIGYNGHLARMRAMTLGEAEPAMTTYTLVFTRPDGEQSTNLAEFKDDASIIADARLALGSDVTSIGIARGCDPDLEFLGAWDWNNGEPTWTPDD